ncbi:MAG: protein kinase [Pirellulales bacterium]
MDTRKQTADTERLLRQARTKVEQLVEQGADHAAAAVLQENPLLASDSESAIELIYAEFLALEEAGRLPNTDQWLSNFPEHRPRLERLLKLHDFLSTDQPVSRADTRSDLIDRPTEQDVADQPFQQYQLLEEVGRGGMGIVYRAIQKGLGRIVAVKVLRSIESHPKVRQRFQQEAETVAALQHPNIVQVIEISLEAGKELLSMEYLGGGSLELRIQNENWSNHDKASMVRTLAQAVNYAHQRGIIHRDLKPANILFTADLIPKIVDFGLAKRLQDEMGTTQTGSVLGTPCYMSPEQAAGAETPIGPATDIYSLGVILYQMLTKQLPFEGKTALETLRWISERDCLPPSKVDPLVPRDLETICLKCLAKQPSERYATAQDLADDLERFLDHLPIKARRAGVIERIGRKIRRHPQVAALVAAIAVVGCGAVFLLYQQQQQVDQLARENAQREHSETLLRQRASEAEGAYEASLEKARASVKEWSQLGQRLDNEPGMDGLRRKAFEDAVAYYQEYLAHGPVDDSIKLEAALAAVRAAHFHTDLGLFETAENELRTAEKWMDGLAETKAIKWYRADIQLLLANILRRVDRWEESQQAYEQVIGMLGELLVKDPKNTGYLIRQSNALVNLCVVFKNQKKWDQCLPTYVHALRLSTTAAALRVQQPIPDAFSQAEVPIEKVSEELDKVTDYLKNLCDKLTSENSKLLPVLARENYLPEIALCLDDIGQVFEYRDQIAQAEMCYREAIRMRRISTELAPENRRVEQYLARGESNLGRMLFANDRVQEAKAALISANRIFERLVEDFPERTEHRTEWSQSLLALAKCNSSQKEVSSALQDAAQSVKQLEILYKQQPKLVGVKDSLANSIFFYSYCLGQANNVAQAKSEYDRAFELAKDRSNPCNSHAWTLALQVQLDSQDLQVALTLSESAVRLSPSSSNAWNTRGLVLTRAGRYMESLEAIDKAISLSNGGSASDWYIKAMAYAGQGDSASALQWFSNAESVRITQSPNKTELRRQAVLASEAIHQEN